MVKPELISRAISVSFCPRLPRLAMSPGDLSRHHHQPSLPPIVKLRLQLSLIQSTRCKGMLTSLPVQDTGRKNTEPVNPNAYLVHDSTESLHLDMYIQK